MSGCCPHLSAFDLLARRHSLTIIWFLQQRNPRRFTEIKMELAVNPATLTQRLCELEQADIIARQEFAELPPRVEYSLTPKGEALLPLMDQLCAWAREWQSPRATAGEARKNPA